MYYVGVDLHKKTISVCVVIQEGGKRRIVQRRNLRCIEVETILQFFAGLGRYLVVVEATASYEWFVRLVEPTAERVVLAHPGKLRVIAESTRKTDKLDAQVLAEFLAFDMIPEAWRPTPRVREHRALVRQRHYVRNRITSVKNKVRHILANYNADIPELFTPKGRTCLAGLELTDADRFTVDMLVEEFDQHEERLKQVTAKLQQFAAQAGIAEREARQVLESIPYVGSVTIDVVLAEVGDIQRFGSQRKATAYAGLAPGIRESAGRGKQLGITKAGSPLLRWALVEAAWRMVGRTRRWGFLYDRLKKRCGVKKAIVAVARRLWCVMVSMLHRGEKYCMASEARATP
jgi:transposase